MNGPAGECRRHEGALLTLLDDPLGRDLDVAARRHLDSCAACRAEIGAVVLASRRVRRSFADARESEPAPGGWHRLQARVQRRQPHLGRASSSILAAALGAALAAAFVLAGGMGPVPGTRESPVQVIYESGLDPWAIAAADRRDEEAELAGLRINALAARAALSDANLDRGWMALIRAELIRQGPRRSPAERSLAAAME
jgi:hypothetical protein